MPGRAQGGIPAELEALVERFAEHRKNRSGVGRLPESLWGAAARLARRYGINRVQQALGLNYQDLKRKMEVRAPTREAPGKRNRKAAPPRFVELGLPSPLMEPLTLVEVEDRKGRKLRVRLGKEQGSELVGLVRELWGGRE
jgi:hypothetical protein